MLRRGCALGIHASRLLSPVHLAQGFQRHLNAHHSLNSMNCRAGPEHPPETAGLEDDDPVEAMMWVAQNEMHMNVVWVDPDEEEESLEDALDDLEDVWLRNPAPPEWAEATGLTQAAADSSTSSSTAADPSSRLATVTWPELAAQLAAGGQAGVILQVNAPPPDGGGDSEPGGRSLPDPLPWAATVASEGSSVEQVSLGLSELTREAAASWHGKTVAVVDTGHHSCLAAAIRLSAVYRVQNVLLLQAA